MKYSLYVLAALATVLLAGAQTPAEKCEGLPPGKHANLERMAASFGLSCEQQLKIEVMLHAEESVSKPLLRFSSFTSDDQQGIMLKLKLAARRQIRTLLTPDQQKQMDQEIDQVAKAGKKGGKGGAAKESAPRANPLEEEGTLSQAVMNYAAFSPAEKKEIVLQVKRAARNDTNLALTPDQQKKLDTEILELSR